MTTLDSQAQREFAVQVLRRLRTRGYEALWAGGCVRDQLLGRTPKDYDVATNATPEQIQQVFSDRKTLAIGAAFGVIAVIGTRRQGTVEVTTFRRDLDYVDGRHPSQVVFSTAQEDAQRRDFTINGLFFDPVDERVIDYVGGEVDLHARVVRAIGDPRQRFTEDKLRMLRGVRFAATFGFQLDEATATAIRQMAGDISVVSPERIAQELRLLFVLPGRARGLELLHDVGLLAVLLPEVSALDDQRRSAAVTLVGELRKPSFSLVLAALLVDVAAEATTVHQLVESIARRWRLSNDELEMTLWLKTHAHSLAHADRKPWSRVQRLFLHEGIEPLVELHAARQRLLGGEQSDVAFCRAKLAEPAEQLNPAPLLTGDDLIALQIPQGKHYATILEQARDAQLDGQIASKDQAIALARSLWQVH